MKNNKSWLLLATMLKSTSKWNTIKYSKDKKKKGNTIAVTIGMGFVWLMLIAFMSLMSIGLGYAGMTQMIPVLCVLMISAMVLVFTILQSNGYLFGFKEYDMLVSLPFDIKSIVACKFIYMYLKNMTLAMCMSIANLIGYAIFGNIKWYVIPLWIVLTFIIPVIPMVIASLIGFVIVKIGSRFKSAKIIQTILTFIFIMLCFCSRFIIEKIAKTTDMQKMMKVASALMGNVSTWYVPAKWFSAGINDGNILEILYLIVSSVIIFVLFLFLVSRSYLQINSRLKVGAAKKKYKLVQQKKKSIVQAIVFKEFKRMLGSTVYLTNVCIGEIMAVVLAVVSIFVKGDKIISIVTQGAPIKPEMLYPAIPFIVYFLIGMVSTTCCTPSLEGKNYWIVQSLPISRKQLYQGKMLFNMILMTPFAVFSSIVLGLSFGADAGYILLYVTLSIALCAFSTCLGMEIGIRHIKLNWENEIEVVKQGAAVAIYIFPNMILTLLLLVGSVILGLFIDGKIVLMIAIAIESLLSLLFYTIVMKMKIRSA